MAFKPICNKDSLNEVIKRDNAILKGTYEKITKQIKINFICNCGEEYTKNVLQLIAVSGAFCKSCTRKTWNERKKATNLERYGVECTVHAPKIKEQIKKNNIEKYGVDNVFKSSQVKEKIKKKMLEKYGVEHAAQSDIIKDKMKQTCLERYGVENIMSCDEFKDKIKQTSLERYGVEHISQTQSFKDKMKETCLERYGVEHASQTQSFKDKIKQTFINNFGVDNPNKLPEIRDKIKKTCLERYGVEHAAQCPEVMEKTQKNAKKYKPYTMPSGEIRQIQGYENYALDELVKTYTEEDIITDRKNIPRISYTANEKTRYYFPDIYIPSINKIIEVKSTWTYKCKLDYINEKAEATRQAGYEYETWIYNKDGKTKQII